MKNRCSLSETKAKLENEPIKMFVPKHCDCFKFSTYACDSDHLVSLDSKRRGLN